MQVSKFAFSYYLFIQYVYSQSVVYCKQIKRTEKKLNYSTEASNLKSLDHSPTNSLGAHVRQITLFIPEGKLSRRAYHIQNRTEILTVAATLSYGVCNSACFRNNISASHSYLTFAVISTLIHDMVIFFQFKFILVLTT